MSIYSPENYYKVQDIIEGYNVKIVQVSSSLELEVQMLELRPSEVVLLEPQIDLMRSVEHYEAKRALKMSKALSQAGTPKLDDDLTLHVISYKDSAEKYIHMSYLEEEKKAFKNLYEAKPKLAIDLKDYQLEDQIRKLELEKKISEGQLSRKGGELTEQDFRRELALAELQAKKFVIAVDTREFSSTTPIHLYEKGFWIVPMQLTVGDYILSDDIAIERKSVATGDLFESFKSGRLL